MTGLELVAQVAHGKQTAHAVVSDALARAKAAKKTGAFVSLQPETALAAAARIDEQIAQGKNPGVLAGLPIAVKDNIAHKDHPCGCASQVLEHYVAPRTATALERLIDAGAVVIGRTNMDEFGMGSSGENSALGVTSNPWDQERVPGGSSSGSAAAVAAGIVPIALGSDTGGSVRQPAAFCGVVGLKPAYGRISRSGLVAFGSSLDQIGPIARSVTDAAAVLQVMSGADPLDGRSHSGPVPDFISACTQDLSGLRIGLDEACWSGGADPEVNQVARAALDALKERGVSLHPVSIPSLAMAIPAYYLITSAEAASNLSRFDGIRYGPRADAEDLLHTYTETRSSRFGTEVQRRILLGTFALSEGHAEAYYQRADAIRNQMRTEMNSALQSVDALAMPTTPTTAFALGAHRNDPVQMYLSDVFTTPPSLTGHPAISVPAGLASGLPVGLQLVGRSMDEGTLLTLASGVEANTGVLQATVSA